MIDTANAHCAANGCIAPAAMTRSTTGTTEWWCGYHFGTEPARIHEITKELRRLDYVVYLTRCLRDFLNTGQWQPVHEEAYTALAQHQRSDLYMSGGNANTPPETHRQWLMRLERELENACKESSGLQQQSK